MRKRIVSTTSPDLLSALKAESNALAAEIAAKLEHKSRVDALITTYEGREVPASKPAPVRKERPKKPPKGQVARTFSGLFYGKALPEACAMQLKIAGEAQTPPQIWNALSREGYVVTAKDPHHAVHWSLRRREKVMGDVMIIEKGKWDLCERYTEAQREQMRSAAAKITMAGRDHESHVEKTKLGIANSKANGVRWGAPVKLTDEARAELIRLRVVEKKSVKEACDAVGIKPASYYATNRGESVHEAVQRAAKEEPKSDLLSAVQGNA
jgi:hypothetical protein